MILNSIKNEIKKHKLLYKVIRNIYGLGYSLSSIITNKRGGIEHFKSTFSLIKHDTKILGKPVNITIEPASVCNLKCPVCETGNGSLGRKAQFMSLQDFQTIIDKVYKHTNTLLYYFMGETFLNKTWVEQVQYAKQKGIPFVWTCSNGDFANAQDIIDSKIDLVSFQIGGMTQETHSTYRVGSKLQRVLANLEQTVRLKKEQNADWLDLEVGLILMKHNEHEVAQFIQFCQNLGLRHNVIDPCVRTISEGQKFLPTNKDNWIYDPISFEQGKLARKFYQDNECPWIHYAMNIAVNGDVLPCCHDPRGTKVMGNLLKQDMQDIWNGEKYQYFRKEIQTNQKDMDICKLCSGYGISKLK